MASFSFILNLLEINGRLPVGLIDNHWLDKANPEQVSKIKDILNAFRVFSQHGFFYEHRQIEEPSANGKSALYQRVELPPDDWRYWVVNFEGYNTEISSLQNAANLMKSEIDFGFQVLGDEFKGSFMWDHVSLFNFYSDPSRFAEQPTVVEAETLKEMGYIYNLIKTLDPRYESIGNSVIEYNEMKRIHERSNIKTIGYFSIIESLITHQPRLPESIDSIMHQINTKMPLLNKRFNSPINISDYFGETSPESIWKKLYSYRSLLAHGGKPDFEKDLRVLRDRGNVNKFLKESLKELMLYALSEAAFISDLKKC